MKNTFSRIGLVKLCGWFGVTRQAYYQATWAQIEGSIEEDLIVKEVRAIRQRHRRIGGRKLIEMLQPFILEHQIKIGRDAFFDMLARNSLLVRKRKRYVKTTNSNHWLRKYPYLIKDVVPQRPNEIWVSDITYWKIDSCENLYISLITDAYSRQIVGYHVADSLAAIESVQALKMALSALGAESPLQLTHHSDRGVQYCSYEYVKLLQDYGIKISMTENGDPLENAIAERVNGILKDEYLNDYIKHSIKEARELIKVSVDLYNTERPHLSISMLTPNKVHYSKEDLNTNRLWKNYYSKESIIVNSKQD